MTEPTNTGSWHPGSPEGLAELARGRHPGTASIVRYFAWDHLPEHLPEHLRDYSAECCRLARYMARADRRIAQAVGGQGLLRPGRPGRAEVTGRVVSTGPRWTAETEELVARAIFAHVHPTGDWGSWSAEPHHDYFGDEARKVLTTLADAGVLTAVGGETRQEWGVLLDRNYVGRSFPTRAAAEAEITERFELGRTFPGEVRQRTVHLGPWREVTDDPA